jgi:hypothetical protein
LGNYSSCGYNNKIFLKGEGKRQMTFQITKHSLFLGPTLSGNFRIETTCPTFSPKAAWQTSVLAFPEYVLLEKREYHFLSWGLAHPREL